MEQKHCWTAIIKTACFPEGIGIGCLPTRAQADETFEGSLATIAGWGKEDEDDFIIEDTPNFAEDRPVIDNIVSALSIVFRARNRN